MYNDPILQVIADIKQYANLMEQEVNDLRKKLSEQNTLISLLSVEKDTLQRKLIELETGIKNTIGAING